MTQVPLFSGSTYKMLDCWTAMGKMYPLGGLFVSIHGAERQTWMWLDLKTHPELESGKERS